MNIIGKWDGTWELKQAMPKFIVWVLMVPFSWFFVQFMLSISAVLTVWVLTLPFDSFADRDFFEGINSQAEICTEVEVFLWKPDEYSGWWEDSDLWESIKCHNYKSIQEFFNGTDTEPGVKNSVFGVISIYTYAVLGVEWMDTLSSGSIQSIWDLMDLWFKIIFDIIFVIVYCILMVALFLALFSRWVWLWVYTMMSPVFWLLYFFWKTSEWVGDEKKFSVKEFINLALVPVYVSAALSFWLVFLFVTSNWLSSTEEGWLNEDGSFDAWGINFLITWTHSDVEEENSLFAWGGSALWKLIVQIFGIAILWIAVITALRSSETTKQITSPIYDFGKSVWKLAAAAPTYAPIIPQSLGWSVAWFSQMWKTITSWIEQSAIRWGSDAAQRFMPDGWQNSWVELSTSAERALSTIRTQWWDGRNEVSLNAVRAVVQEWGDSRAISNNTRALELIRAYLAQLGIQQEVTQWNATSVANALWAIDDATKNIGGWLFRNPEDALTARSNAAAVDAAITRAATPAAAEPAPAAWSGTVNNITINPSNIWWVTVSWTNVNNIEELRNEIWSENLRVENATRIRELLRWLTESDWTTRRYSDEAVETIISALNLES